MNRAIVAALTLLAGLALAQTVNPNSGTPVYITNPALPTTPGANSFTGLYPDAGAAPMLTTPQGSLAPALGDVTGKALIGGSVPYVPSGFVTGDNGAFGTISADVNEDGVKDLIVVGRTGNTVTIMLTNTVTLNGVKVGTGTFTKKASYTVGTSPRWAALCDFNEDHHLDMVVTNNTGTTQTILMGVGDGTFTAGTNITTDFSGAQGVACGRFGTVTTSTHYSIVVAQRGNTGMDYFPGNGDGTFGTITDLTLTSASDPRQVVLDDLNDDGLLDIVTVGSSSNSVATFFGTSTATTFQTLAIQTGPWGAPTFIAIEDVNNDMIPDVVVGATGGINVALGIRSGSNNWVLNVANIYQVFSPYQRGTNTTTGVPYIVDFNNDGQWDIVSSIQDSVGLNNGVVFLAGNGSGTFALQKFTRIAAVDYGGIGKAQIINTLGMATADFNGDGLPDFVVTDFAAGAGSVNAYSLNSVSIPVVAPAAGTTIGIQMQGDAGLPMYLNGQGSQSSNPIYVVVGSKTGAGFAATAATGNAFTSNDATGGYSSARIEVTWAGITGSPAGCQFYASDSNSNQIGQSIQTTAGTAMNASLTGVVGQLDTVTQWHFTCTTYPGAGTVTLVPTYTGTPPQAANVGVSDAGQPGYSALMGAIAVPLNAAPAQTTNGSLAPLTTDPSNRLLVNDSHPNKFTCAVRTSVPAACEPVNYVGAGQSFFLTDIDISNNPTAQTVLIIDGCDGGAPVTRRIYDYAVSGGRAGPLKTPIEFNTQSDMCCAPQDGGLVDCNFTGYIDKH